MLFKDLYGTQLDLELASADRTQLFTTARRQKAINDAMHQFEDITSCTPVYGTIPIAMKANAIPTNATTISAGGTGYVLNDIVTVSGGTSTTAAQFNVSAVSGGVVTAVTVNTAGSYTVLPANPVTTTGGTGSGLTLTASWTGISEYNLLSNFSNYYTLKDKEEPGIKRVDASGNVTWIQGDNLARRSPAWNDREIPGWRADTGTTPTNWYLRNDAGNAFVGLDPPPVAPTGETWTLLVPYLALSDDMVNDGDVPFSINGIPLQTLIPYHQGLVHYAAMLLEMGRKNYTVAQAQQAKFAQYVTKFFIRFNKEQTNDVVYARNYFREAGKPIRAVDPHRFP